MKFRQILNEGLNFNPDEGYLNDYVDMYANWSKYVRDLKDNKTSTYADRYIYNFVDGIRT